MRMYSTTPLWLDNAEDFKCVPWLQLQEPGPVQSQKAANNSRVPGVNRRCQVLATCAASGCHSAESTQTCFPRSLAARHRRLLHFALDDCCGKPEVPTRRATSGRRPTVHSTSRSLCTSAAVEELCLALLSSRFRCSTAR